MAVAPDELASTMSMREWLATNAPLPAKLTDGMVKAALHERKDNAGQQDLLAQLIAKWSFRYADAMLAEAAKHG